MKLFDLSLATMPPTWEASFGAADAWFPELVGSVEARALTFEARNLLRAFAIMARSQDVKRPDMGLVREFIMEAAQNPCAAFCRPMKYQEAGEILEVALKGRGSGFSDPLQFLALNITDERAQFASVRWPWKS